MSYEAEHVRDRLAEYAVGGLEQIERDAVESHLSRCVDCSNALRSLRDVEDLARSAPLRPETPRDLEDRVFAHVHADHAVQIAPQAAIGPEPPSDLERRALERAGVLAPARPRRQRVATILAPTFAAAAAVLSFMYMNARDDAAPNRVASNSPNTGSVAEAAVGQPPVGHPMQTIEMDGESIAADLELVHFKHDNYRLALHASDVPGCSAKSFYEVWLREEGGDEISAGSFRIVRPDDIVFNFNVGIDPADYYLVEVTREPMEGGPSKEGPVIMTGALDPAHVEHD